MQESPLRASQPPPLSDQRYPILSLYSSARIQEINEAVIEMEWNGFAIDTDYFGVQAAKARANQAAILASLRDLLVEGGVKHGTPDDIWSSPKQLTRLLEEDLGLPPSPYWFKGKVKLNAGERKTDRVALEWIESHAVRPGVNVAARRIVAGVMALRRVSSSLKYLEKLPRYVGPDGFVHPVCGPAGDEDDRVGAITGRLGVKNPEAHQIPRDKRKDAYNIRRGFVAPAGQLLVVRDYTALEVVIMANICEWLFDDTLLLELTAPGMDIHSFNAHRVFGTLLKQRTPSGRPIADARLEEFKTDPELAWYRDAIKAVWYKLQYGGTVHGFATSLRDERGEPVGFGRAGEIVGALYEAVPSIPRWTDLVARIMRRDGSITALDGRLVDYSDLIARDDPSSDRQWAFDAACRGAQNHPMQGTGAHVIGCAMADEADCPEMRRLGAKLELQVHDEMRWRCPEANVARVDGLADEIMSGAFPLKNLRTAGGIGHTWSDCK